VTANLLSNNNGMMLFHACIFVYILGRLLRVDLIQSVRLSAESFFYFTEIWYVGRGRWVMHDGMQYDPIQGQGHEPLKVRNSAISKAISSPIYNDGWQMTTDS